MIYKLPFYYSTLRLHAIDGIELVKDRVNKLKQNFDLKCQISQYSHLNDLVV